MTLFFPLLEGQKAAEKVTALQDKLVSVYKLAFEAAPYYKSAHEVDEFARFLPLHTADHGFRIVLAFDTAKGAPVGYAYGRIVTPGQPWCEIIRELLEPLGLAYLLENAFQLVEMAVLPNRQGQGIGGRLHDCLLQGTVQHRALLTTMAADTAAKRMYLGRGWRSVIPSFAVPPLPRPYQLMERPLKT